MIGTVGDMLAVCRAELGTVEGPNNHTEYAACAGHKDHEAWCMTFLCCMAKRANVPLPRDTASTVAMADAFLDLGRFGQRPQLGAFGFIFIPKLGRIGHVFAVEAVRADSVVSIEGNTDVKGGRTGGKVMRHVRRKVVGYGYPMYRPAPRPPTARVDRHLGLATPLMHGQDVLNVQRALNRLGNHLPESGIYDQQTANTVNLFNRRHHLLGPDGKPARGVAPATWAELRKAVH